MKVKEYIGVIYVACEDDDDVVATVTCRNQKEFREIAEGSAITLDEPVRFIGLDAFIGYNLED